MYDKLLTTKPVRTRGNAPQTEEGLLSAAGYYEKEAIKDAV